MGVYKDLNDYEVMYLVEEQDENAKDVLFQKYRPIIQKIASQYKTDAKRCGLEFEDLVQEGYLGLYSALNTYDSKSNVLFYTYAIISIRSKILNILTLRNARKHYYLNNGISLSNVIFDQEECELINFLEDKSAIKPHLLLEDIEFEQNIRKFLLNLDFIQSSILELRMNGFSNHHIALLLELSIKQVSNSLFQIRKKLREYLKFSS